MVKENQKYGKLTTKYVVGITKNRAKIWHCYCECGNEVDVASSSLSTGNTRSCGCLRKETARRNGEFNRCKNKYDLNRSYGIGYTANGDRFYFDLEDFDKIKKYTWNLNSDGYVISQPFGKTLRMHMLVMNSDGAYDVDHLNHITYDNRKKNLRLIKHYQNITYSKTYSNNTSGRKGVYWDKSRNKWMSCITYNKKTKHLGRFDLYEDAVKAREEAEKNIHSIYHYNE